MAVRVELDTDSVRALMQSPEMQSILLETADEIRDRCGEGYASDCIIMETRAISSVYTENYTAMRDNLKNNTILKAMGSST